MYTQTFNPKELYHYVTQAERRNKGLAEDTFVNMCQALGEDAIIGGTFPLLFRNSGELYLNGQTTDSFRLCQDVILRKLSHNIERIYAVRQSDRNFIIKQMKSLLAEKREEGFFLVRLDVKSYYENVDTQSLYERFVNDGRLTTATLHYVKSILGSTMPLPGAGLPRGLSSCAMMAEIYLKHFDLDMQHVSGVYYYARFVDDIIVFCIDEDTAKSVWQTAKERLSELGLAINRKKSFIWKSLAPKRTLTYLGYLFRFDAKGILQIEIAPSKVNKIKSRLVVALLSYRDSADYNLLKMRVQFLTGNYVMHDKRRLKPIHVGVRYNYSQVTTWDQLDELDTFLNHLLHSRAAAFRTLTSAQLSELNKYHFQTGRENKIHYSFTATELKNIKSCWR